jgi:hypothetical protein
MPTVLMLPLLLRMCLARTQVPIPVWNDADDDDTFHVCSSGLEDLPDTQQQQQQAAAAEHGAHSSSSVGDQSSAGGSQSSGGQSRGGGSQSSGDQSSGSGGSSGFKYIKDYRCGGVCWGNCHSCAPVCLLLCAGMAAMDFAVRHRFWGQCIEH